MMQVIFSKIELETPPFLTVIQFYSNIDKKRVGKNPREISTWPTFRNILKAVFQLRVFHTYVHTRKSLNPF